MLPCAIKGAETPPTASGLAESSRTSQNSVLLSQTLFCPSTLTGKTFIFITWLVSSIGAKSQLRSRWEFSLRSSLGVGLILSGWIHLYSLLKESTLFKKPFYLFIFRERGREQERERGENINAWLPLVYSQLGSWPTTQACAQTGNWTDNPLIHRPGLNPLSQTSQGKSLLFLKKDFIYFLFCRERRREGERQRNSNAWEKHRSVGSSHMPPGGALACNPGICPDQELNQRPLSLRDDTQPTEPH